MSNPVKPLSLTDFLAPKAREELNARVAARAEVLAAARTQLAAITDTLARAVLDLHTEDVHSECRGDDMDGYEAERPGWPCRTVQIIAKHYGILLEAS